MVSTLVTYIIFLILGLGFQQFAFMQMVREFPPYRRVERITMAAVSFLTLAWATGTYYYTRFYETFEQAKILSGEYPLAHSLLAETKVWMLLFAPFFSLIFLVLVKKTKIDDELKQKKIAILIALLAIGFATLNLGTEILIGGAAN